MMKTLKFKVWIFLLLLQSLTAHSQVDIILRKTFVDSLKNSIAFDSQFKIAKAHKNPNSPSKDGDLHIAGIDETIGLPVIAEIMNAKDEKDAVNIIHSNEGESNSISIKGVWRIWCEHAGSKEKQEQGGTFPPITNTNPNHVFEIHPVTQVENIGIIGSLKPIKGYKYKKTFDAFSKYSNAKCKIVDKQDKISVETKGIGYNYVEFWIEILGNNQNVVNDGRFVSCNVRDKNRELISTNIRMVFPKDSEAEKKVKSLNKDDIMHVIGVPRISLDIISQRIDNAREHPEMLDFNLPFEMIIVATFER